MPKFRVWLIAKCAIEVEGDTELDAICEAQEGCTEPPYWLANDIEEITQ